MNAVEVLRRDQAFLCWHGSPSLKMRRFTLLSASACSSSLPVPSLRSSDACCRQILSLWPLTVYFVVYNTSIQAEKRIFGGGGQIFEYRRPFAVEKGLPGEDLFPTGRNHEPKSASGIFKILLPKTALRVLESDPGIQRQRSDTFLRSRGKFLGRLPCFDRRHSLSLSACSLS
jgi:hypothetical protein